MPKTRAQKEELLSGLQDRLERSSSVVLLGVTGVKVTQFEAMRDAIFPQGMQLQVAKNSLFTQALVSKGLQVPRELLDQPLALVFSYHDQVAAAKAITPFLKEVEALTVLGGIVDGKYLNASQIEALAKLPSREQLLGQLVGTIQAPLSGLVNVLHGTIRGLVQVLAQVRDARTA